jgi:phage tail sheath protein FI
MSLTVQSKAAQSSDIEIEVAPPTGDTPPEGAFTLKIKMGGVQESFDNVSVGRSRNTKNVVDTVNQTSQLISILEAQTIGSLVDRMPETGTYVLKASSQPGLPAVQTKTFTGDVAARSGIEGLEIAEDATMVCCPDLMAAYESKLIDKETVKAVQLSLIAHCERLGDRMAIIDPPPGLTPQEVKDWREKDSNFDSRFAALYYPWLKVAGPDGQSITVPPSGHMAGIYARSDNERGVHKAPANEVIRGVLEAASQITKGEQNMLNPIGVNCIRSFTGRGVRVWGARTLSSDPAWRYINVRRLFSFVEKSIERGTHWVVFEPNDPDLWARVRRDVGAFLTGVWRSGALFGLTQDEAFFVKCDAETNPPDVRDRGQLIIEIGLAPVKPAEFVIFRLSQFAGGGA